ncbi:MAG: hypothetical protein IK129_06605 [Deltaproteobacteria bacterium]|nr:hypothetical protein [Deltaproteobacteria bacterium]
MNIADMENTGYVLIAMIVLASIFLLFIVIEFIYYEINDKLFLVKNMDSLTNILFFMGIFFLLMCAVYFALMEKYILSSAFVIVLLYSIFRYRQSGKKEPEVPPEFDSF